MTRRIGMLMVVLLLLFTQSGAGWQVVEDSTSYTTGEFFGCPPEGRGGDPDLNRLKNRDRPPLQYQSVTINRLLTFAPDEMIEMGKRHRAKWSSKALESANTSENRGVVVEGILIAVLRQAPESCNCGDSLQRDYHLTVVAASDGDRSGAVIAEISPRLLPQHTGWNGQALRALAKRRAKVRISGWLMWDGEHGASVGKTRGTCWEIHPVHRIEVKDLERWREL